MADVVLIYPYFRTPAENKSIFRFPPLGLGYIAAYLSQHGIEVQLIDCTFRTEAEVVEQVSRMNPRIIGIQCLLSLEQKALQLARILKKRDNLLITGGPYPTINPAFCLNDFDLVVLGEGEQTTLEIVHRFGQDDNYQAIPGVAYKNYEQKFVYTPPRPMLKDLDSLPFPARALYPNNIYQTYWRQRFGYAITSLLATRGCPFNCDYCSRAVSGNFYRERSPENVVDEMEEILGYGYDRIWIADDVFTLRKGYVLNICAEILRRQLKFQWECLSRVDTLDLEMAYKMKAAGCSRVFFGIESGNNAILHEMNKKNTTEQAVSAVRIARRAGLGTGGFFMLGYPGETDETILQTLRLANSLPLDYISFTLPYPLPGTGLYDKVKDKLLPVYWHSSQQGIVKHKLVFESNFSEAKLNFARFKGKVQFQMRKLCGRRNFWPYNLFEKTTDWIFKLMT